MFTKITQISTSGVMTSQTRYKSINIAILCSKFLTNETYYRKTVSYEVYMNLFGSFSKTDYSPISKTQGQNLLQVSLLLKQVQPQSTGSYIKRMYFYNGSLSFLSPVQIQTQKRKRLWRVNT